MLLVARLNQLLGTRGIAVLHAGSWSLVAKACAAANLFLSIPLAMHALDATQFGVWVTLVSLTTFAGFLDFGFSNGTMNLLAAAMGKGSSEAVAHTFRQSLRVLAGVAVLLAIASGLIWVTVPWDRLFGLAHDPDFHSFAAIGCLLLAIVLSVPLNLGHRVRLGIGQGDRAFKWQAAGQLAALMAVASVSRFEPSLAALTAAAVLTPLLASLGNTASLFRDPLLRPRETIDPAHGRAIRQSIRTEGALFFILQLAAALAFSTDLAIISFLHDPAMAGPYAIVQRLFALVPLALSLVWVPLWPVYRTALASGNFDWASRTLKRTIIVAGTFAAFVSTAIILGYEPIIHLLPDGIAKASTLLLVGFGVWSVFEAVGTAIGTFLNSASVMRFQLISSITFAITCLATKTLIVLSGEISWLPWATIGTYALTFAIPMIFYWRPLMAGVKTRRY